MSLDMQMVNFLLGGGLGWQGVQGHFWRQLLHYLMKMNREPGRRKDTDFPKQQESRDSWEGFLQD